MRTAALLLLAACGSSPTAPAPAPVASHARAPVPPSKGVHHPVADRFVIALEAGDANGVAATFAETGTFVRHMGRDASGPAAIAPVFVQAFGYCRMHVTHVLERASSLVVTTTSECKHPEFEHVQSHLFQIDTANDRITRAAVSTQILGNPNEKPIPRFDELEDPSTLTEEREKLATCDVDRYVGMLSDFKGTTHTVWATATCIVATVKLPAPSHGYVDVECEPRNKSYCTVPHGSKRYVDWNGYRLLPFADPEHVYVNKTRDAR